MKQVISRIPSRILALVAGLVLSVGAFAQQITVNGLVKDASGFEVMGAHVRVVGQDGGAVTDLDGKFQIQADKGARIEVSFIGYRTANVAAAPRVNVVLEEDAVALNDVVVIGYGVAKKNDLTGSVVAIKPDEKNHGFQVSPQEMLQGKIAGVNVNMSSGAPGDGARIVIRGGSSLNASNNPLIVIDGMPMDANNIKGMNNPLALVNPNDIETFTVLKDASATAIYGSRGSNGVIIITTKKGTKNQAAKLSYNGSLSVSAISKKLNVMNAAQYVDAIRKQYGENSSAYLGLGWKKFNADGTPDVAAGTYETDWQDEVYKTGISHDHSVTLDGGASGKHWNLPYRVSLGYTDHKGILRGSDFSRFNVGFNLAPSLLDDHLNLNVNAKYIYTETHEGGRGAIGACLTMDPTRPVKSNDPMFKNWGGYWQWAAETSVYDPTFPYGLKLDAPVNPREIVDHYNNSRNANVMLGNLEIDYKIHGFEDLRLHANLSGQYSDGGEYTTNNPMSTYGYYFGGNGKNTERKYNLTASAYAQYYKDFSDDHHFDIMGGYEYQHMKYWGHNYYSDFYPQTFLGLDDDGNPKAGTINNETDTEWQGQTFIVSWMARANYTLKNRYLFTASMRADGSSRFADGHRWGFFPSAAAAWRINDEAWMRNAKSVSDMKLRLSWGRTGQQDTGKEYYTPIYSMGTSPNYTYPIGPNNPGVIYQPKEYNNDLTWETTTTYNAGFDLGLFKQRLTMNVDAYYRKTTDLLCHPTIPTGQNFDNQIWMNAGSLENVGVEFAIAGKPVQTKDWLVDLGVNMAWNRNKITELYGGKDVISAGMSIGDANVTYHKVGMPANTFWVHQQVYDESGRPVMGCYVDRDGNGIIDDNDRYYYKSTMAPIQGGFYLKVAYKNWDLGANFRYSIGNYVYNDIEQGKVNVAEMYSSKGFYENRTPEMVDLGWTSFNYKTSDYFVQNGSFLKCDNITLGYSFKNLFKAPNYHGIDGRIYASCSNVFTVTKYKGLDPEQTSGRESDLYPRSRTFMLGVNLNF